MKRLLSILISILIVVYSSLCVFAADEEQSTDPDINFFTSSMFEQFLGHYDFTSIDFTAFQNFTDYSFMSFDYKNNDDSQYYDGPCYGMGVNALSIDATDYDLTFSGGIVYLSANCTKYYGFKPNVKSIFPYSSLDSLSKVNFSVWGWDRDFVIVNDLFVYNKIYSLVQEAIVNGYNISSDNLYYCPDIKSAFLDYINDDYLDFIDVSQKLDGYDNLITYYDSFDCYKSYFGYDYYSDDIQKNYLNAGLNVKGELYYSKSGVNKSDVLVPSQHNDLYTFYLLAGESDFGDFSGDKEFISQITQEQINNALNELIKVNHYKGYDISFTDWYSHYVNKYINANYNIQLQSVTVPPSTDKRPTVNKSSDYKDLIFIKFVLPSSYSYIESSDSSRNIMLGVKISSTAELVDEKFCIEKGLDGVGGNIDKSSSDDPTRQELLDMGFTNGYPNKSSYPYKITINNSGKVLYEIYFNKKPNVTSYFYSEQYINYKVDFENLEGYFYSPSNNCSYAFDFYSVIDEDVNNKDYWQFGEVNFPDPFDVITDWLKGGAVSTFLYEIGVDPDVFANTRIMNFWTNYTGVFPKSYQGYYIQFNWDLSLSDNFHKDNSDDDYNYSQDYLPDDSIKDNNGNIHGGAVEQPTAETVVNGFNNEDFSFDENGLWDYADSFLGFTARAFRVFPAFIWQLIACSIVVIIILRVLGR